MVEVAKVAENIENNIKEEKKMNAKAQKVVEFDKEKNLKLWKSVEKTDPKYTKRVSYGNRAFTTVDAYYQIRNATALWGPYGSTWGLKDPEVSFIDVDDPKNGRSKMVIYKATFYYPDGEFVEYNSMKIKDDEFMKKIQTDTLTKALSRLGFNADIFLGLFDDARYVEKLKKEFSQNENAEQNGAKSAKEIEETLKNMGLKLDENGKVVGKTYGKQEILKKLGFKWDSQNKCWFMPNWVAPQETQQAKPETSEENPTSKDDDIPF